MALEYNVTVKDNASRTINDIGKNVNVLALNFTKLDTRINTTNNHFTKLEKNTIQSLSKMGAALSGAASIGIAKVSGALFDLGREMLQSYDSASKLSDNIGVAANSIVGLRYAADKSSVGAKNMDQNMAKLAQTIAKASSGNKEATDTFAKMGIEVKNSDGTLKNSEQVLMEMADAFQKLPAGTERATLAMDVFGKSGASMVTMLKDGSGALRENVFQKNLPFFKKIMYIIRRGKENAILGNRSIFAFVCVRYRLQTGRLFSKTEKDRKRSRYAYCPQRYGKRNEGKGNKQRYYKQNEVVFLKLKNNRGDTWL